MVKKKQNTPQGYRRKDVGKGKNPRNICPVCGKYLIKSQSKITNIEGERVSIHPNEFCKCGYVEVNEKELKKIPD